MADRRFLKFDELDDMIPEVDRLLGGYEVVGDWSLGQVCRHLSITFNLLVRGGPAPEIALDPTRDFDATRRWFLRQERFPDGIKAPLAAVIPPPGLDDREEAESLRASLARFVAHPGPFPPHPRIGPLTKDEWIYFHRLHAAHHLGFLVPAAH